MNVKHPLGALHSFSFKNIVMIRWLKIYYFRVFRVTICFYESKTYLGTCTSVIYHIEQEFKEFPRISS